MLRGSPVASSQGIRGYTSAMANLKFSNFVNTHKFFQNNCETSLIGYTFFE